MARKSQAKGVRNVRGLRVAFFQFILGLDLDLSVGREAILRQTKFRNQGVVLL